MNIMNLRLMIAISTILLAGLAAARTEPNSFLNKPAYSQSALIKQVESDAVVASRFSRHFGMTKSEVISYFKTLKLTELQEDGVYLVYNVPDTEEVRARAIFYKKGTKVWIDQNGGLVLKASCGNPMARGTDVQTVPVEAEFNGETNLVSRTTPLDMQTDTILETSATPMPINVETSALAYPMVPPAAVQGIGGGGFNPAFLLPLAAVPFIVDKPKEPVPEPATMAIMAVGAGLLARKRRKAKQA